MGSSASNSKFFLLVHMSNVLVEVDIGVGVSQNQNNKDLHPLSPSIHKGIVVIS